MESAYVNKFRVNRVKELKGRPHAMTIMGVPKLLSARVQTSRKLQVDFMQTSLHFNLESNSQSLNTKILNLVLKGI